MLEIFSRLCLQKFARITEIMASVSFGVFLIHAHPLVWRYIFSRLFPYQSFVKYHPILLILAVIGSSLTIYIVCTIIDYLRLLLFNLLKVKHLLEKLETKLRGNPNNNNNNDDNEEETIKEI